MTLGVPLLSLTGWALCIAVVHQVYPENPFWVSPLPLTVAGAALSIFLGFRNNAAYDRYWEGRKLWGSLVNMSRTFARQLITFLQEEPPEPPEPPEAGDRGDKPRPERERFIREMSYRAIGFVHALRHHLRGEDPKLELAAFLSAEEMDRLQEVRNVPNGVLALIGGQLAAARRRGWLDSIQLAALDSTLTDLANIQGGCERIRNTPLPPVYTDVSDRVVFAFCGLLPFGLVVDLGMLTPFLVGIVSFTFLVLARISSLLENPFGFRPNDLPLTTLCRTIEADIRQTLAERDVPPALEPVNGILL